MRAQVIVAAVGMLLAAACTSGGGGPDDAVAKRLRAGFDRIENDRTLSVELSITRDADDDEGERTLSCLSVGVDPRYAKGDHVHLTNWGASTTLDGDGGCLGGGDPRSVVVVGTLVYVETGPAPPREVACLASYSRKRLSAMAQSQLASFTRAQGPDVDDLLKAASGGSFDPGGETARIAIDPDKAASLSRPGAASSSATADSVSMTVTFAGRDSSRIDKIEIDTAAGDDTVRVRAVYSSASPADAAPPPKQCVKPGLGTVSTLDELKSALGF